MNKYSNQILERLSSNRFTINTRIFHRVGKFIKINSVIFLVSIKQYCDLKMIWKTSKLDTLEIKLQKISSKPSLTLFKLILLQIPADQILDLIRRVFIPPSAGMKSDRFEAISNAKYVHIWAKALEPILKMVVNKGILVSDVSTCV